jgi:hypothetical protein
MAGADSVVAEYEVFRNDKNALAFFFSRLPVLDQNPAEGPFWFTVEDSCILAGTGDFHATFEDVQPDIIDIAKQRGVIMMIEFENQQPVRCTPCYFSDNF